MTDHLEMVTKTTIRIPTHDGSIKLSKYDSIDKKGTNRIDYELHGRTEFKEDILIKIIAGFQSLMEME